MNACLKLHDNSSNSCLTFQVNIAIPRATCPFVYFSTEPLRNKQLLLNLSTSLDTINIGNLGEIALSVIPNYLI